MFELWKDDQSRVRLDENSQASSFLGSYWVDRTNWTAIETPPYSASYATLNVHNDTVFVMMGTTDGQIVAIESISQGNGVKVLNLVATARAGMWFYCFGARNVTTSNCGMQFLDVNGNVTFDSQAKWFRFAGFERNPVYNQDYPWPAGVPTVAVGMAQRGTWLQPNQVGQYRSFMIMTYGLRISTGLAAYRVIPRQGPLGNAATSPQPPPGALFYADVTRY